MVGNRIYEQLYRCPMVGEELDLYAKKFFSAFLRSVSTERAITVTVRVPENYTACTY